MFLEGICVVQQPGQPTPQGAVGIGQQGEGGAPAGGQPGQQCSVHPLEGSVRAAVVRFHQGKDALIQYQPGRLRAGDDLTGFGKAAVFLDKTGIGGAVFAQVFLPPATLDGAQAVLIQQGAPPI